MLVSSSFASPFSKKLDLQPSLCFPSSSSDYPPHVKISMPALSPTMTSGNVGKWSKKIGDAVSPGDAIVEIETDKATMDYECQEEGFLAKVLVPSGTKDIAVNTVTFFFSFF